MLQRTLFRKGGEALAGRGAGAVEKARKGVELVKAVGRDPRNKQWKKPGKTQIANFNNRELHKKLLKPVTAKELGSIAHIINIPERKDRHSKWYLHCRRLEEQALKESVGADERMVRSQEALSVTAGGAYEEHNAKRKRAPDSHIIAELKGVPEKGKLIRDESKRSKEAEARKRERMQEAIREVVTKEVYSGNFPAFDTSITVGKAEIAEVVLSSDKKRAYLYYQPPPLARDQVQAAKDWTERLETAKGFLRSAVARRIRTRHVPTLEFRLYDEAQFKAYKKMLDRKKNVDIDKIQVFDGNYDEDDEDDDVEDDDVEETTDVDNEVPEVQATTAVETKAESQKPA